MPEINVSLMKKHTRAILNQIPPMNEVTANETPQFYRLTVVLPWYMRGACVVGVLQRIHGTFTPISCLRLSFKPPLGLMV